MSLRLKLQFIGFLVERIRIFTQDFIASFGTPDRPRGGRVAPLNESQTPWNNKILSLSSPRGFLVRQEPTGTYP